MQRDPQNATWLRGLGLLCNRISSVLSEQGNYLDALESASRALEIRKKLVERSPKNSQWREDLASSHNQYSRVLSASHDSKEALAQAMAGLQIREALSLGDASSADNLLALAASLERVGLVYLSDSEFDKAKEFLVRAEVVLRNLLKRDSQNLAWLDQLSDVLASLGLTLEFRGDLLAALELYKEDLRISEKLVGSADMKIDWKRDVAYALLNVGRMEMALGQIEQAHTKFTQSIDVLAKLQSFQRPNSHLDYAGGLCLGIAAATLLGKDDVCKDLVATLRQVEVSAGAADTPMRAMLLSLLRSSPAFGQRTM